MCGFLNYYEMYHYVEKSDRKDTSIRTELLFVLFGEQIKSKKRTKIPGVNQSFLKNPKFDPVIKLILVLTSNLLSEQTLGACKNCLFHCFLWKSCPVFRWRQPAIHLGAFIENSEYSQNLNQKMFQGSTLGR